MSKSIAQRLKEEAEAQAKEEQAELEKRRVVNILMDHGISAAKGRQVSELAGSERRRSAKSISSVRSMIEGYDQEVLEHKKRISVLEIAEVERLCKEIAYKEELLKNSGKPKNYFKVPELQVKGRDRRTQSRAENLAMANLTQQQPKSRSVRGYRHELDEPTQRLKELLTRRKVELRDFLDSDSSKGENNSRKPAAGSFFSGRRPPQHHRRLMSP